MNSTINPADIAGRVNRAPLIQSLVSWALQSPEFDGDDLPELEAELSAMPTKSLLHPMALFRKGVFEPTNRRGLTAITTAHINLVKRHVDLFDLTPIEVLPAHCADTRMIEFSAPEAKPTRKLPAKKRKPKQRFHMIYLSGRYQMVPCQMAA
jgi:hypothetical protein